ncbi:FixH family protein [Rhodoplanes sp. Z2-YC6860]|uniref:FixH family protein n=1 Tax=Rhodoplanes sp. Z2-YC6860 TaxID=674703 RepID=UPI00078B5877|nr:FixH family protein [Rhodoplanes sp. Z2-YC6860]AMN45000.1 nitrogen fixation protein FixH [Rhodoplanes sp. Z2-YC6860]
MSELQLSGGGAAGPKKVTGWTVLGCLVAFFAIVMGVNGFMIRAAVTTFGGVETESSYKAGLALSRELKAAQAQEARHWDVRAHVTPGSEKQWVEITARDAQGKPLSGLTAVVRFNHPTDRRADVDMTPREVTPGRFAGSAAPAAGQWDLVIELMRGEERVFLSRNRIVVKQG